MSRRVTVTAWPESEPSRARAGQDKHVIADIDFHTPGIPPELAPTTCSCGWAGKALEYQAHRRSAGAGSRWVTDADGRRRRAPAA